MDWMTVGIAAAALIVGVAIGRATKAAEAPEVPPAPPDAGALERVRPLLEKGDKIAAIKAYREATGVGLRDAKLAVESLETPGR